MMPRIFIAVAMAGVCLNAAASEIDLSKPVSASVPEITGIYWNFDDLSDATPMVEDASGNNHAGHLEAGEGEKPTAVEGVNIKGVSGFKTALRLATTAAKPGGKGNPRVTANLPVENNLAMSGMDFTGGLWVRFFSVSGAGDQMAILLGRGCHSVRLGESDAGLYVLFLQRRNGEWRIGFQTGDGFELCTIYSDPLFDFDAEVWHHLGFNVRGRPGGESSVTLWLDGNKIAELPLAVAITSGNEDSMVRRFAVGDRTTSNFGSLFDGAVDDVFVTEGIYDFSLKGAKVP